METAEALRRLNPFPDPAMAAADLQQLRTTLVDHLSRYGFAYLATPISEPLFEALALQLGAVAQRNDIIIDRAQHAERQRGRRSEAPTVYQAESLGLHTDVASADLLAWYCVEQDDHDGTTLLLDSQNMSDYFTANELAMLSQIQNPYLYPKPGLGGLGVARAPVVAHGGGRYRIFFYIPWSLPTKVEPAQADLLDKLAQYVRSQQQTELIRIRLAKGEGLFIDNHRMLHGRGALPEGSKRHLIRYYIETPAGEIAS